MANGYVTSSQWPLLVDGVGAGKKDLRASCHLLVGCSEPLRQVFLILYIIELVLFSCQNVSLFVKLCLYLSIFCHYLSFYSLFVRICLGCPKSPMNPSPRNLRRRNRSMKNVVRELLMRFSQRTWMGLAHLSPSFLIQVLCSRLGHGSKHDVGLCRTHTMVFCPARMLNQLRLTVMVITLSAAQSSRTTVMSLSSTQNPSAPTLNRFHWPARTGNAGLNMINCLGRRLENQVYHRRR